MRRGKVAPPATASSNPNQGSLSLAATLTARQKTHGDFKVHAAITQRLKAVMETTEGWVKLSPSQKETLHMNAHKIGRILAGNPDFPDHWHDIAGYAKLVEDELSAS